MRHLLLDFLCCPYCASFPLQLFIIKSDAAESEEGPEVKEALLMCQGCSAWFPVRDGIPSLMSRKLRAKEERQFLDEWRDKLPPEIFETAVSWSERNCADDDEDQIEFADKRQEMKVRDQEADIYDSLFPADKFKTELGSYQRLIQPLSGAVVLEVGCGTGRVTRTFVKKTALTIGVDFSLESLRYFADRQYADCRLQLVQADACNVPFRSEVFDIVVSFGLFCHLPGEEVRSRFLLKAASVLKQQGVLVISAYNYSLLKRLLNLLGLATTGRKEGHKPDGVYYYNHTRRELLAQVAPLFDVSDLIGTDNRLPVVQHLSAVLSARVDALLGSMPFTLPFVARELTIRGIKK